MKANTYCQSGQQMHAQNAVIYSSQPQNNTTFSNSTQIQETTQKDKTNPENQWQQVKKRYRTQNDRNGQRTQNQNYWLDQPVETTNRYDALSQESMENEDEKTTEPKPPPIFIAGVKNIKPLLELLNTIAKDKYILKTLQNDQVKVQPLEGPVYTTIIKSLMEKNTEFHTYKSKQDRSYRVVLKNLHPTTDLEEIKLSLKNKGHEVTNIWNVKQRITNKSLPMHFVDIKPSDNNKDIYKIDILLNTKVTIEAPHAKREIPQVYALSKIRTHQKLL